MNRIRIGKEFTVRWSVTVNGGDSELASFDFTVLMQYPSKRNLKMDFTIDGNDIVIPINRDLQTEIGKYTLELWANKDKEGQSVIDYCDAFSLVPRSCMENESQSESDIETVEDINLSTSGIEIGVIGKSAYQIWLENGNEGTEQDFLSWIKKPAEESAQSAISASSLASSAASLASEKPYRRRVPHLPPYWLQKQLFSLQSLHPRWQKKAVNWLRL